jgi:16S rRNA (cytidine1402-2'-O)-methyltransferase
MTQESPAFYVVATPIGNLADITLRALEVLRRVPLIAAEDTRHTRHLCAHYGIAARLLAAHEHNEARVAGTVVGHLQAGESVAFVSDAGTPAISDPGARLVAAVRAAGFAVVPLPGPCAAVAALSVAGLAEATWTFRGFLPHKAVARRSVLQSLLALPEAQVFYEAPHRVIESLQAIAEVFGDRRVVLAKELTKVFEAVVDGSAARLLAWLAADDDRARGEFVLIVAGAPPAGDDDGEAARVLAILLDGGLPVRQSADLTAAITGSSRKKLYEQALAHRAQSATLADD